MNLRNAFRQLLNVFDLGDDEDSRDRSRYDRRRDWDDDDDDDDRRYRRSDGRRRERDDDSFDIG